MCLLFYEGGQHLHHGYFLQQPCSNGIAETDLDCPCDEDTYNVMISNYSLIAAESACPSFDDMIKWDVGSISSEFVLWMSDDDAQPGSTSLVGLLSSSAFEGMISKFVDRSLSKHVRLLVKLTSYLYSCEGRASYADCDSSLRSLRSFVGTRVLQELEPALGNSSLAAALLEKLTALFLILFATIIAVGYSEPQSPAGHLGSSVSGLPVYQSPALNESCTSDRLAQVYSETQEHLLRILAHQMVYIAERIDLLAPNVSRKRIIEGAACRWNRRATFQGNEMSAHEDAGVQSNLVSFCDVQDNSKRADRSLSTGNPARCLHFSRSHSPKSSCRLAGGFGTCVHEENMNIEPSPMDLILAHYQHQQTTSAPPDVQAPIERISSLRVDLESTQHAPHSTRRCSSDHLLSSSTKDGNYAAFEYLAGMDEMCAPFLCTDDDDDDDDDDYDNANEASSMDGTSALTTSPSSLQSSEQSFSIASRSSLRSQDLKSTYDTNTDQGSVCRSCKFAALPFGTLDQDDLCQFCSALPRPGDDISALSSNDLPDQGSPAQGQLDRPRHEHGSVRLLV